MKRLHCNRPGCDEPIIFAARPNTRRRLPYEAADREPFSVAATGSHVLVAGKAWVPGDLIEYFRTQFEISEDRARELVSGYPWHRPHIHDRDTTEREGTFP